MWIVGTRYKKPRITGTDLEQVRSFYPRSEGPLFGWLTLRIKGEEFTGGSARAIEISAMPEGAGRSRRDYVPRGRDEIRERCRAWSVRHEVPVRRLQSRSRRWCRSQSKSLYA